MTSHAEHRTSHWTSLLWKENYLHNEKGWFYRNVNSNFLNCAAQNGLTLYVASKLQAMGRTTGILAANSLLLIHAMGTHTADECQLNPDLIKMLLRYGNEPLNSWTICHDTVSAWSALLDHEAGRDPPDLRWDRWKKIAAIFVKHIHSLDQIAEVQNLLGQARSISSLSASFVRKRLKRKTKQLATVETPLQSPGRTPPEQST